MKIVSREQLLNEPYGTIYQEHNRMTHPCGAFEGLYRKLAVKGNNDGFFYFNLFDPQGLTYFNGDHNKGSAYQVFETVDILNLINSLSMVK